MKEILITEFSAKRIYNTILLLTTFAISTPILSQTEYDSISVKVIKMVSNTAIDSSFYKNGVVRLWKCYQYGGLYETSTLSPNGDTIYILTMRRNGGLKGTSTDVLCVWDSAHVGAEINEFTYHRYYFRTDIYINNELTEIYYNEFTLKNGQVISTVEKYKNGKFRYRIDTTTDNVSGKKKKKKIHQKANYDPRQIHPK